MSDQWFAVHDTDGNAVSFGSVVADKDVLDDKGLVAVPVPEADVLDPLRVWDAEAKAHRDATEQERAALSPAPRTLTDADVQAIAQALAKMQA